MLRGCLRRRYHYSYNTVPGMSYLSVFLLKKRVRCSRNMFLKVVWEVVAFRVFSSGNFFEELRPDPPPPPKNTRYLENNTWLSQIVQAVRAHGKLMISVFRIFPRTRNARQPTSIPPDYGVNTMVHACTVPTANATTNVFSYVGGRGYRRHVACIRMFSCILLFVLQLLL